ncbi:MAG: NUDIX domain-containing protein [Spirochaetaceae bacterium]
MKVEFYNLNYSANLKYSVIVAKDDKGFVFVRHNSRNTWEIPGGHIEDGETALEAARRELIEETGAIDFDIKEVCIYSVQRDSTKSYGSLFYADIKKYSNKLEHEIIEVQSSKKLMEKLTYPFIQPQLFEKVLKTLT